MLLISEIYEQLYNFNLLPLTIFNGTKMYIFSKISFSDIKRVHISIYVTFHEI